MNTQKVRATLTKAYLNKNMTFKKETERLAKLARIALKKEEAEEISQDLSLILDYFKILKTVDTSKINDKDFSLEDKVKNRVREDKEKKFSDREALIRSFLNKEKNYLKVKEVLN